MRFNQFKKNEIVESLLNEVDMSPGSLKRWANSSDTEGMLMGIEFEMGVPDIVDDSESDEYDYSMDEPAYSIEHIVDFYEIGSFESNNLNTLYQESWDEEFNSMMDTKDDEIEERTRYLLEHEYYDADEARERAIEQLGPDASDDEVQSLTQSIINDDLDEIMNDATSRDYLAAYNEARNEIFEEETHEFDYSEMDWLRSIGVRNLSDAESEFGYEWPHTLSESTATISQLAEEFSKVVNYRVKPGTGYKSVKRGDWWVVEIDPSIEVDDPKDGKMEFVSPTPPPPIATTLNVIERVWDWANSYGCYTNESTGLHMNISIPNFSIEKLDYIKLAIFCGDKYVLEKFSRLGNEFCHSAIDIIQRKTNEDNIKVALEKMRAALSTEASKLIHYGYTNKYTSINVKDGWVEFRGPGNDYLNMDLHEITNTALRLAMAVKIACDENAYRREYAKKLYKLIAPQDSDNSIVSIFSLYAAGTLDRKTLVTTLQNIHRARKSGLVKWKFVNVLNGKVKYLEIPATTVSQAAEWFANESGVDVEQVYNRCTITKVEDQRQLLQQPSQQQQVPSAPASTTQRSQLPDPESRRWRITHIPSGRSFSWRGETAEQARDSAALELNIPIDNFRVEEI